MRLDLGCGTPNTKAPGHVGIDIVQTADIVWDLNKGLPLPQNGFQLNDKFPEALHDIEGIRCHQLIEHMSTIIPLMNDCYQVLKPGAIFEISTPVAGTKQFWQDPTHIKGYVFDSFHYFEKDSILPDAQKEYGITARFIILDSWIEQGWNLQVRLTK